MKHIQLFEALTKLTPNEVLKEYDLTTKELDRIIDILTKYKLDDVLLRELKATQTRGYRDLRKWKVDSFIGRYEILRPRVEELMNVQDYFLELSDMGYGIFVSSRDRTVRIRIGGHKKKDLFGSVSEIINFLNHLNARKRLIVKLLNIDHQSDSNFDDDEDYDDDKDILFVVSYDPTSMPLL